MLSGVLLATLLAATSQEASSDVPELLEKLSSGSIEEREDAATQLIEKGSSVLPLLKAVDTPKDPEARARILHVIHEIGRHERIKFVRPPSLRVTLKLKHVTPDAAAQRVFSSFGVKATFDGFGSDWGIIPVSLELHKARFWEAVDIFSASAHASLKPSYPFAPSKDDLERVTFIPSALWTEPPFHSANVGAVKIFARANGRTQDGDVRFTFGVALSPGTFPLHIDVYDTKAGDLALKRQPSEWPRYWPIFRKRPSPGGIHTFSLQHWSTAIARSSLEGAKTISLKGVVSVTYPHDLERVELTPESLPKTVSKEIDGVTLTYSSTSTDGVRTESVLTWKSQEHAPIQKILLWREDSSGRWLGDVQLITTIPGESKTITWWSENTKLVMARFLGQDHVQNQFVIRDFPIPKLPRRKKQY